MRPGQIQIGPNQGRAAERRQNAALAWRFPRGNLIDRGAKLRRFRSACRQPPRKRTDQFAVAAEPEHLETGQPASAQPGAVVLNGSLLIGEPRWIRTIDPLIKSQTIYDAL